MRQWRPKPVRRRDSSMACCDCRSVSRPWKTCRKIWQRDWRARAAERGAAGAIADGGYMGRIVGTTTARRRAWSLGSLVLLAVAAAAQQPLKEWTTAEDHQNMMAQLGITKLRPGPSGNEADPNHANYDESLANPYPKLPEVLTLKNGRKVTTASQWQRQRRPEIIEDFEREVLGRVPANAPKITWVVTETAMTQVGGHAVNARRLTGHADNSGFPQIDVNMQMVLVTPADAKKPVPVMILFGRAAMPGEPPPAIPGRPAVAFTPPPGSDPPATEQLIAAGWGYAYLNPTSIQADNGAGLTRGIIGLANKGQPRKPEDWGALRAWGWGASRALDYLATDQSVDAKR